MHLIYAQKTLRTGQTTGLYYSRSADGGATWSNPQLLSENDIQWADIVSYGDKTVQVVWQEYDGLVFANLSQVSLDGGSTWGKQNIFSGVTSESTPVALASDGHGLLHFLQLTKKNESAIVNQENLVLQDWEWDGSNWKPRLTKDISFKKE